MEANKEERLAYTPMELVDILGMSISSIYKAIENNQIPHIRIGGKILIPKNRLAAYLKGESK